MERSWSMREAAQQEMGEQCKSWVAMAAAIPVGRYKFHLARVLQDPRGRSRSLQPMAQMVEAVPSASHREQPPTAQAET